MLRAHFEEVFEVGGYVLKSAWEQEGHGSR